MLIGRWLSPVHSAGLVCTSEQIINECVLSPTTDVDESRRRLGSVTNEADKEVEKQSKSRPPKIQPVSEYYESSGTQTC